MTAARIVDLPSFAKEIAHPEPIYFQRQAAAWLAHLRRQAQQLRLGGISLDWFDALRAELNLRNGVALSNLELARKTLERSPPGAVLRFERDAGTLGATEMARYLGDARSRVQQDPARSVAWKRARVWGFWARQEAHQALRGLAGSFSAVPEGRVLLVVRHGDLLRHALPVAHELMNRPAAGGCWFGTADAAVARDATAAGLPAHDLHDVGQVRPLALFRYFRTLIQQTRRATAEPAYGFDTQQARVLRVVTRQTVALLGLDLIRVALALIDVLETGRVGVVFVANPYTMEGRLAWRIGRALGIPSVTLQHGTAFPNDPIWDECDVDRFCVWGEASGRALAQFGLPAERIVVTGSPRLDAIVRTVESKTARDARVLVATSGPGDRVSLTQHLEFIRLLYEAAALTPEIKWSVKLHPKDDARLYSAVAPSHPRAQVEILPGGKTRDIFELLEQSAALLTATSAAALDAMAVRIPVITAALTADPPGQTGIDFIDRGSTAHVRDSAELVAAAREAVSGTLLRRLDSSMNAIVADHFANVGGASKAVADVVSALAGDATSLTRVSRE